VVSTFSDWGDCSKTCGYGTQRRSRTVTTARKSGGAACPVLNEHRQCNAHACPKDCVVSSFDNWSACSKSCGVGVKSRSRTVLLKPTTDGTACPALYETQVCDQQPCALDCQVSEWTAFSVCTKTCQDVSDPGTQTRSRMILSMDAHGGKPCPALRESNACNTIPCPLDCETSDWSGWSKCDKTCGGGVQRRNRSILNHADREGYVCPPLADSRPCNTACCATDCTTSPWSDWSTCSKTCGTGSQRRTRTVATKSSCGGAP